MMTKKLDVLSSRFIAATVTLFVALISGCDRRDEVYPLEGNGYAKDPVYLTQLESQVAARNEIVKDRAKTAAALEALLKKHGGDRAAVEATEEGRALVARLNMSEELFVSNRMETARIMQERVARAVADSERIKRGEAKPIDISKKK